MRSALLACFLLGCASTARISGDFDDYASYRRARLAMTREERLGASFEYLQAFPRGDYREEVRAWFAPAEKRYFRLAQDNPDRLRAYLSVMPHGPHAEQVAERLAELETRRVFAERRDARVLSHARVVQAALVDADASRRRFVSESLALIRLVAGVHTFGESTSELDSDLIWQFRLRPPYGECAADLCRKTFVFEYAVPEEKQLGARSVSVELTMDLERGELRSVALSGQHLFDRITEAVEVRPIGDGSPDRTAALERARELVQDAIESVLPEASCKAPAEQANLLVRRCHGVRFELATSNDGLDRARISADRTR